MNLKTYDELKEAIRNRYVSPRYGDSLEFTLAAGESKDDVLRVPAGSDFLVDMVNMSYTEEEDGSCLIDVKLTGIVGNTSYTADYMPVDLLATPGSSSRGIRFGGLPWAAMIPAEDGLKVYVVNRSTETRKFKIALWGKRFVGLTSEERTEIQREVLGS